MIQEMTTMMMMMMMMMILNKYRFQICETH